MTDAPPGVNHLRRLRTRQNPTAIRALAWLVRPSAPGMRERRRLAHDAGVGLFVTLSGAAHGAPVASQLSLPVATTAICLGLRSAPDSGLPDACDNNSTLNNIPVAH